MMRNDKVTKLVWCATFMRHSVRSSHIPGGIDVLLINSLKYNKLHNYTSTQTKTV